MRAKNSRFKKSISLVLAATMMLSACAAGFTAFAAGERDLSDTTKIEAAIFADTKNASGVETNTEKLKDDLKVAFKGLSNENKEKISPLAIAKIYKMAYESATGTSAAKASGAVDALGAYTPKVQAGIDLVTFMSGLTPTKIDGVDYLAKLSYFPFDKVYTSAKIDYSIEIQKNLMEKAIGMYKAADPYSLEIADCFYASSTYTYSMGGYYLNTTTPILTAISKYVNFFDMKDKTAAEKQAYIFNALDIKAGKSYKLMETITEYTDAKYTAAANTFAASNKDATAIAAFKAVVEPSVKKTVYSYSLESKVAGLSSNIILLGDALTSVSSIWGQVVEQYQPILDAEATAPVIAKINEAAKNLSGITTSALAEKIFVDAGHNNLSYSQKQLVIQEAATAVAAIQRVVYIVDTKAFVDSVNGYTIPVLTAENKDQVAKDSAKFVTAYGALKSDFKAVSTSRSTLQNFIKTEYPSTETKYQQIVNLGKDVGILNFETSVKNFSATQKPSADLNEKITALKAEYKALSTDLKNYFTANRPTESAKFTKILGLWLPVEEKGTHVAPQVVDSQLGSKENAEMVTGAVSTVITQLVNNLLKPILNAGDKDLSTAITNVFTNEMVTEAVKLVVPALYDLIKSMNMEVNLGAIYKLEDLFQFTPEGIADRVTNIEQFIKLGVIEKLTAMGNTPADFAKMPADFDWGVKDGDYDTFMTALLGVIARSLNTGLAGGLIISGWTTNMIVGEYSATPDKSAVDQSTVKQGGYNAFIIPILEALGAKDIPTGLEYAMLVNDEKGKKASSDPKIYETRNSSSSAVMLDSILRPVVDVLYKQVLQPAAKDPGKYVLENLPNLVYHLNDGCIFENLMATLDANPIPMANLNVGDTIRTALGGDLSLELIFNMLTKAKTAEDGTVTAPLLDLKALGIDLELKDITGLAGAGTAQTVDTAKDVDSTIKIVGDKVKVVSYLVETLIPAIDVNGLIAGLISTEIKGQFVKVEVPAYPHDGKMDKKAMNKLISGLDQTILGFINIEDAINGALATQDMAADAITTIYKLIPSLLKDNLGVDYEISPAEVAKRMTGKPYADIVKYLSIPGLTWEQVNFRPKNDDGKLLDGATNMGFKDGDFDGFIKCLVASLRPIVELVQSTGLLTNQTVDGKVVYGLYETLIIPMFEAIGLTPAATSATYTKNYNSLAIKDATTATDYLLQTILDPIIKMLNKFEKDPIATVMTILPNIAYALRYNPQTAFIGNLLLGDKNLADVLNGLVSGFAPGLVLNPINLDALISAGTIKTDNKSMSALNGTYTSVVADKADTFVTVFYYLFDTINTGKNLEIIKTMVSEIKDMDASLKTLVDSLMGVFDMSREDALCAIGATFGEWTCPDGADGKGTNGKTPGTGDMTIATVVVMSALFTAGIAIVLLRKKKTIVE